MTARFSLQQIFCQGSTSWKIGLPWLIASSLHFYWALCGWVFLPQTDFWAQKKEKKKSDVLPFGCFTLFKRGRKTGRIPLYNIVCFQNFICFQKALSPVLFITTQNVVQYREDCKGLIRFRYWLLLLHSVFCLQVQNHCKEERRNLALQCFCLYRLHKQKVCSKIRLSTLWKTLLSCKKKALSFYMRKN